METTGYIILLVLELAIVSWLVMNFISGIISSFHGAPYVPVRAWMMRPLLTFVDAGPADAFYDLGSGDGRMLILAKREFGVSRAIGYEVGSWPYWKSRWLIRHSGLQGISVHHQNLFYGDYRDATCMYLYLFPKLIDRLAKKFSEELRPGARVLCLSFPIDTKRHTQFRLKKSEKIGTLTAYLYEKI